MARLIEYLDDFRRSVNWRQFSVFLVLISLMAYTLWNQSNNQALTNYSNLVAGCKRGAERDATVMVPFLTFARNARSASALNDGSGNAAIDRKAAENYQSLIDRLHDIDKVPCDERYKRP